MWPPPHQNTPLFVKQFGDDDPVRLQLAMFTSLDMVEERLKSDTPYLGMLCPLEDYKVCVSFTMLAARVCLCLCVWAKVRVS